MIVENEDLLIIDPCLITLNTNIKGITGATGIGDGIWEIYEKINNPDETEESLIQFIEKVEQKQEQFFNHNRSKNILNELDKLKIQRKFIGKVKVDSGTISVLLLNDLLTNFPNSLDSIDDKAYTIIKNFSGKIDFYETNKTNKSLKETRILGLGNIVFFTNHIITL